MTKRRLAILSVALFFSLQPLFPQDSKENADFKLALNLYNDGLFDLAAEQLRQFVGSYPTTSQGIEARFFLGLTQLKLKRYEDARITFQTFALNYQDNPRAAEAWLHTGEAYSAMNNAREAALAFERVKVFHPKSKSAPDALLQAAHSFTLAGQRDDSKRVLRVILQEYPASGAVLAARTLLGKMYFEDGNTEQAQNELRRVIEGDPSADARAQALLILGNINQALLRTEQAQANYQEIITRYKNSSALQGALVNLGKSQAEGGKYAEAAENYRKALALKANADSSLLRDAMFGLAAAEDGQKNPAGAIAAYGKFLAAFPADDHASEALWNMALAGSRAKQYAVSNGACQRLTHMQGGYRRLAQIRLARNAEEERNPSGAIEAYQAFVDQNPEDPAAAEVLLTIGRLYEERLHDARKASAVYEQLATRYPRAPAACRALAGAARCHELLKETDRALDLYRELVSLFPASDERPGAGKRIAMLETFDAKDKDGGLEKLALLVGDVVAEKDRVGLSYRLGEIYFHQMKNYEAAAVQFTNAINSGMSDARFVDALFLRAKAYENLALRDEKYRPRAIESYQTFVQSYSEDPRAREAMVSLFFLRATNPSAARTALQGVPSDRRDTMLLRLGELLERADSSADALPIYETVARQSRDSGSATEAAYRSALLFGKAGQVDSALAWGGIYLARAPEGAHAAQVLTAMGEMQRKDPAQAIPLYRRLAGEFAYTAAGSEARPRLAEALAASGNADEAVAVYRDLVREEQENALNESGVSTPLLLGLARAEQQAGHTVEAKTRLLELLAREGSGKEAGQAYTLLGSIAKGEGALEAATAYFRSAEKASPGVAATREVADLLFNAGNYSDAIKQYAELAKAAQADTDRQYCESRIILARLRSDDIPGANRDIAAFKERYGKADEALAAFELERGNYFFRKGDHASAMKTFADVAKRYDDTPSAPEARYWTGKTLQSAGKIPEAVATLEELIKDHPEADIIPRAHLALGILYYDEEKWPESIRHYRLITDDPKADPSLLPYANSNLIEAYEVAKVNDAALALTRRYLELYPNNEDSFDKKIKIGILYDRLGYYDQAVMHLQGLLDQAGSDLEGEIRYYIAEANFNKGDYQQAILDFLKVPYLVTKKGKIDWTANSLYMSGQSYEKMGRFDQALTMYQQIVERTGIDETFKTAARKEIDRVRLVLKKKAVD